MKFKIPVIKPENDNLDNVLKFIKDKIKNNKDSEKKSKES